MCPNSILKRLFTFLRILSGLHTHILHIQTYIRVCNETFYSKVFQIYICCNNTESVEKSRQSEIMGICVRLPLHRFSIRWKKALDTEKKEQITILDLEYFAVFVVSVRICINLLWICTKNIRSRTKTKATTSVLKLLKNKNKENTQRQSAIHFGCVFNWLCAKSGVWNNYGHCNWN